MVKSTQDKATVQEYTEKLIQMTNGFCESYLDEEYKALCEKLIRKMSRKRVVPFLSGKIEIWAAGIVYALVLRSLKAIRKEAAVVAMIFGRSTPDPGVGSPVELS